VKFLSHEEKEKNKKMQKVSILNFKLDLDLNLNWKLSMKAKTDLPRQWQAANLARASTVAGFRLLLQTIQI